MTNRLILPGLKTPSVGNWRSDDRDVRDRCSVGLEALMQSIEVGYCHTLMISLGSHFQWLNARWLVEEEKKVWWRKDYAHRRVRRRAARRKPSIKQNHRK
jgi:hypothetical protein